jgi:hypothetical protein
VTPDDLIVDLTGRYVFSRAAIRPARLFVWASGNALETLDCRLSSETMWGGPLIWFFVYLSVVPDNRYCSRTIRGAEEAWRPGPKSSQSAERTQYEPQIVSMEADRLEAVA